MSLGLWASSQSSISSLVSAVCQPLSGFQITLFASVAQRNRVTEISFSETPGEAMALAWRKGLSPHAQVLENLELFAAKVIPRFA